MKLLILIGLCSLVLISGCVNCGYGYACDARCKGKEADRLCGQFIDDMQKQNEIASRGCDELSEYISKHNLTCNTNESMQIPIDSQRTVYKCCRTCYIYNENGSDTTEQICKLDGA